MFNNTALLYARGTYVFLRNGCCTAEIPTYNLYYMYRYIYYIIYTVANLDDFFFKIQTMHGRTICMHMTDALVLPLLLYSRVFRYNDDEVL